jgi:hypothetical protein
MRAAARAEDVQEENMLGSPDVGGRSVRAATRASRLGTGRHGPMRQIAQKVLGSGPGVSSGCVESSDFGT